MENRHLNVNNSPTHSINNSISNLTISDGLPNSNLNPINNHLQRRNEHSTMKRKLFHYFDLLYNHMFITLYITCPYIYIALNPNAEMFIPRCMMIPSNQTSSYVGNPQHPNSSTNNHPISNGNPHNQYHHHQQQQHNHQLHSNNGTIQNSSSFLDGETDIEDYVALSYLKEFIGNISNMPSHYDQGISEITFIVNSYLDEDECVLELIVNQIVDQVLSKNNFFVNKLFISSFFSQLLMLTFVTMVFVCAFISWKRLGRQILDKHLRIFFLRGKLLYSLFLYSIFISVLFRCQRECSRKVSQSTSSNTFNHLRGLSVFVADLYLRCKETQLADNLPNLLMNILSSNNNIDENVKCVCQVLKVTLILVKFYQVTKDVGNSYSFVEKRLIYILENKRRMT